MAETRRHRRAAGGAARAAHGGDRVRGGGAAAPAARPRCPAATSRCWSARAARSRPRERVRALVAQADLRRRRRGGRRGRRPARRPAAGARGRPGRHAAAARPTSTSSCTAPATCRSTRRSTRASAPTWSAPASLLARVREVGAATSTTCTSPRRTSPGGAAAPSRRRRSSTTSTSRPSWPGGSAPARGGRAPQPRPRRLLGPRAQEGREGALARRDARPRPRRPRRPAVRLGQGRAGPRRHRAGRAAWAGPTATPSPRRSASGWSRRTRAEGHRGLDRAAQHRRVGAREALPGLDRGLQDGRAADPGLRPRRAAGVPGRPPTRSSTSCRSTTWSARDRRGAGLPPERGDAGLLPRLLGRPQPADVQRALRAVRDYFDRAPVRRQRPRRGAAAEVAVPRRPHRSSGC